MIGGGSFPPRTWDLIFMGSSWVLWSIANDRRAVGPAAHVRLDLHGESSLRVTSVIDDRRRTEPAPQQDSIFMIALLNWLEISRG
jgi:hypothetical protein